jgi:dipeptidyl aminopeptidase/acylaminoacyl peptidase
MIAQGANDPRVKRAESDQMVAALRSKGIPVSYLLFPDEGHGFERAGEHSQLLCPGRGVPWLRILAAAVSRTIP